MQAVSNPPTHAQPAETGREAFYARLDKDNLTPLWEVLHALVPPLPQTACLPALWKYDAIRPYIMESGRLITAMEAVRRVLVLENPGLRGQSAITRSLYCGLQLILPGETAPSHRHTQSALRFIVEGSGAYTAVDGERTTMRPGDFIITPSWTWHDHGNPGEEPVVWMDGLDIQILQLFGAQFMETFTEDVQPVSKNEGDSSARYGNNMVPLGPLPSSKTSPIFNYPYSYTREALEKAKLRDEWDACHGLKLKFSNPETGDFAMPTIGTFIQLLPKGFKTARYRSTDATVFAAIEGKGRSRIGEQTFEWGPRDLFVAPSWQWVTHEADADSVLFSFSDRPVQQKLDLFRDDRGNA